MNKSLERMKSAEAKLSPKLLREAFSYDPKTGIMTWKKVPWAPARIKVLLGKKAGYNSPNKYAMVKIQQRLYRVHRIIWAVVTGKWPKEYIDHKNSDPYDNRWDNLREATHTENNLNRVRTENASGFRRVLWHKKNKNWMAVIKHKGKSRHLGSFPTREEAYMVACSAAKALQGEFARFD